MQEKKDPCANEIASSRTGGKGVKAELAMGTRKPLIVMSLLLLMVKGRNPEALPLTV